MIVVDVYLREEGADDDKMGRIRVQVRDVEHQEGAGYAAEYPIIDSTYGDYGINDILRFE